MGRRIGWVLRRTVCGVAIATMVVVVGRGDSASAQAAPPSNAKSAAKSAALRMQTVTLHIFHRAFANFHDKVDARLHQEFRIGDSEYTGTVIQFVPDFALDLKTHRVSTRSQEPNNPAFHVVVRKNGVPQDTTWALLNMPPHFARKSLIAFLATRVTFENHEAVTSRDSLAQRLMQREKP